MWGRGLHDNAHDKQGRTNEVPTVDGLGKEREAQDQGHCFASGGGQARHQRAKTAGQTGHAEHPAVAASGKSPQTHERHCTGRSEVDVDELQGRRQFPSGEASDQQEQGTAGVGRKDHFVFGTAELREAVVLSKKQRRERKVESSSRRTREQEIHRMPWASVQQT